MPSDVNVGINSIQIIGEVRGVIGPDGRVKANLHIDSGDGVKLNLPVSHFPFLKPNEPCFIVIAVMQVNPKEQLIEEVKSKLII